jgi:hypothetical protein
MLCNSSEWADSMIIKSLAAVGLGGLVALGVMAQ